MKRDNSDKQQPLDVDKLMDHIERNLSEIEQEEFVHGYTEEEMEDTGLLDENHIDITRSKYSTVNVLDDFCMYDTVDYIVCSGYKNSKEIPWEEYGHLITVDAGAVIARIIINPREELSYYNKFIDELYLENANLKVVKHANILEFHSKIAGKVVLLNTLLYVLNSDVNGSFKITISQDYLEAHAQIFTAHGTGKPVLLADILGGLQEKKVIFGIDEEVIQKLLQKLSHKDINEVNGCVAQGVMPADGNDASVNYRFSLCETMEDIKVLPDGRVDYRRKAKVPFVKMDTVLAQLTEAGKGTSGTNVFGVQLPAKSGDNMVIYSGENVTFRKDTNEFVAEIDGLPSLNGNILSVFRTYVVNGDVDYNTGNIEFDGNIIVKGNVLPGFEVKATGDITIMNNVDGGIISAGRDVQVSGGVIGGGSAVIECGRNASLGHTHHAYVEAQGDILIGSAALHSKLYCSGNVVLQNDKGALVGGVVYAYKSIHAISIGARSGVKTEIAVGHDFLIKKQLTKCEDNLKFCEKNIVKIQQVLTPILKLQESEEEVSDQKKRNIALVIKKYNTLLKHKKLMEAKIKHLKKVQVNPEKTTIKVRDKIYSDVLIQIKHRRKLIKRSYPTCKIILEEKSGEILVVKF